MRLTSLLLILAVFACAAPPIVTSVVSAADGHANIVTDSFATAYGSGLSVGTYTPVTFPWPTKLGGTEVFACVTIQQILQPPVLTAGCTALPLLLASPGQINFYVPAKTLGSYLAFRVDGAVFDPRTFTQQTGTGDIRISPASIAPAIFQAGFDCYTEPDITGYDFNCGLSWLGGAARATRGAITDLAGSLISSANPARIGQFLILWATGVSGADAAKLTVALLSGRPIGPPFSNCCFPAQITPSYAGNSSLLGLYQINFQVPQSFVKDGPTGYPYGFPCGTYQWEIPISISTFNTGGRGPGSGGVDLPLKVLPADIAGCHQ